VAPEVIAAFITGGFGIGVAALGQAEPIASLFNGRNRQSGLLRGTWHCTWTDTASPGIPVNDTVTISRTFGGRLRGEGAAADYGSYRLRGEVSRLTATMRYEGTQHGSKEQTGVVILHLGSDGDLLTGCWSQLGRDSTWRSGTTSWKRQ
jgi:hypothetical protein